MKSRVAQLMGVDYKFDIMMSDDGSGRGAALVAAVLKETDHQAWLTVSTNSNNFSTFYIKERPLDNFTNAKHGIVIS